MPRSRAAADFYNMASSCFDIVSNIIPSPIKVNSNNKSDCVCVAEPTDINLYELKDFMDGQIEEIKGILVLSTAPVSLVETLYTDVIKSYNEEGPYSLPPIDKVTELYNSFNEIIDLGKKIFREVRVFKPKSSRKDSKESFVICKKLR